MNLLTHSVLLPVPHLTGTDVSITKHHNNNVPYALSKQVSAQSSTTRILPQIKYLPAMLPPMIRQKSGKRTAN